MSICQTRDINVCPDIKAEAVPKFLSVSSEPIGLFSSPTRAIKSTAILPSSYRLSLTTVLSFKLLLGLRRRWAKSWNARVFLFWGRSICSRDLFETSWERLLSIVNTEKSRVFMCVLTLPQWCCSRNFEPLVSHTNVHPECGRSWRTFLERFLVEMILTPMHILRPSILA